MSLNPPPPRPIAQQTCSGMVGVILFLTASWGPSEGLNFLVFEMNYFFEFKVKVEYWPKQLKIYHSRKNSYVRPIISDCYTNEKRVVLLCSSENHWWTYQWESRLMPANWFSISMSTSYGLWCCLFWYLSRGGSHLEEMSYSVWEHNKTVQDPSQCWQF